jgi:hypothetical protein
LMEFGGRAYLEWVNPFEWWPVSSRFYGEVSRWFLWTMATVELGVHGQPVWRERMALPRVYRKPAATAGSSMRRCCGHAGSSPITSAASDWLPSVGMGG